MDSLDTKSHLEKNQKANSTFNITLLLRHFYTARQTPALQFLPSLVETVAGHAGALRQKPWLRRPIKALGCPHFCRAERRGAPIWQLSNAPFDSRSFLREAVYLTFQERHLLSRQIRIEAQS
jgi:hypothetical protein